MSLIRRPNQAAVLEARINALESEKRVLETQLSQVQATADAAVTEAQNLADEIDCADCSDMDALKCIADGAKYDTLDVQNIYRNELCGNHWRSAFNKCGLSESFCQLQQLFGALLAEREYELAIASHNLAFCAAQSAPDCIAENVAALEATIESDENMDSRCRGYIAQLLAIANA